MLFYRHTGSYWMRSNCWYRGCYHLFFSEIIGYIRACATFITVYKCIMGLRLIRNILLKCEGLVNQEFDVLLFFFFVQNLCVSCHLLKEDLLLLERFLFFFFFYSRQFIIRVLIFLFNISADKFFFVQSFFSWIFF